MAAGGHIGFRKKVNILFLLLEFNVLAIKHRDIPLYDVDKIKEKNAWQKTHFLIQDGGHLENRG